MITFKLIDGKPVPHMWTMPEKDTGFQKPYKDIITHARENAVPVKEEFRDVVKQAVFYEISKSSHGIPIIDSDIKLTRDYDVDMEFEIKNECSDVARGWRESFQYCLRINCPKSECQFPVKVAIPKQTKEIEPIKNHYCTYPNKCDCGPFKGCTKPIVVPEQKESPIEVSEEKLKEIQQSEVLIINDVKYIRQDKVESILKKWRDKLSPRSVKEEKDDDSLLQELSREELIERVNRLQDFNDEAQKYISKLQNEKLLLSAQLEIHTHLTFHQVTGELIREPKIKELESSAGDKEEQSKLWKLAMHHSGGQMNPVKWLSENFSITRKTKQL